MGNSGIEPWQHLVHCRVKWMSLIKKYLEKIKPRVGCHQYKRILKPVIDWPEIVDILGYGVGQEKLIVPGSPENEWEKIVFGERFVKAEIAVSSIIEHFFTRTRNLNHSFFQYHLLSHCKAKIVDGLVNQQFKSEARRLISPLDIQSKCLNWNQAIGSGTFNNQRLGKI